MIWDIETPILSNGSLILPFVFSSSILAIEITADNYRPTWEQAGYIQSLIDVDGDNFNGNNLKLTFSRQIVQFPYLSYQLKYEPRGWLVNPIIRVKQLTPSQSINIMPLYSALPTAFGRLPVVDSIPTTFSAPAYLAATLPAAYQCLAANPARQSYAITNTGTVPVYLDLDAPTTAIKRMITIAIGGTYVSDIPYVGAVFIWSSNAAAQACEVRDFIQ